MSYKVLARKWRPQHFNDMIGQDHVLQALVNALDNQRLHHAYLFTGMRGVGKTTIARIFAKCLNCETKGVSSAPCGTCSVCQDIEAGRFFDLIEVDAASRTKVDQTRELLENVPYAPASGRYKVYLIDEVHMFSDSSFNALLKTLEEPPEHVKFLLATTDPQKVPVTVLSRCLQFNLKRVPPARLAEYLGQVLTDESIGFDESALELIAQASEGSVRDSLSLVEQAIAFGNAEIRQDAVESMLGRVSTDRLIELIECITQADASTLFTKVDTLAQYAPDYDLLLAEMLSLFHRMAMVQTLDNNNNEEAREGKQRLQALAKTTDADALQLFYQIALHARRDMPYAPDQREAFDMALLRMMTFMPQTLAQAVPATSAANVPPVAAPSAAALSAAQSGATAPNQAATPAAPSAQPAASAVSAMQTAAEPQPTAPAAAATPPVAVPPVAIQPVATQPVSAMSINADNWPETVAALGLAGMPMQLASNCAFVSVSETELALQLEEISEHLNTPAFTAKLRDALRAHTNSEINVSIEMVNQPLHTPARVAEQQQNDAMQAARDSIDDDPHVKALLNQIDGTVEDKSVRPVSESE